MSFAGILNLIATLLQSWPFIILMVTLVLRREIGKVANALSVRIQKGSMEVQYKDTVIRFPEVREP